MSFKCEQFVGGDVFEGSDKAFGSAGTSEIVFFASLKKAQQFKGEAFVQTVCMCVGRGGATAGCMAVRHRAQATHEGVSGWIGHAKFIYY